MKNPKPLEKRTKVDSGIVERRGIAFRITRNQAWLAIVAGSLLVGFLDFWTADRLWVGPAYLPMVAIAAWVLGWREAVALTLVIMAYAVLINDTALHPYGPVSSPWDFMMRIPPVLAIIALLAHARGTCEREWRMARTDPLTGALNRKAFFELAGSIDNAKGWHVLAYADLDGLKALNDRHGHERGDNTLRVFASQVQRAIRKDDVFARIGGDEFLVYMAVRDENAGNIVAHRLHRAMNSASTELAEGLNCSVGVLILAPGPRSIDRELRVADELMYDAKQSGSALTAATAHEHLGSLAITARWTLTGATAHTAFVDRDLREMRRAEVKIATRPVATEAPDGTAAAA